VPRRGGRSFPPLRRGRAGRLRGGPYASGVGQPAASWRHRPFITTNNTAPVPRNRFRVHVGVGVADRAHKESGRKQQHCRMTFHTSNPTKPQSTRVGSIRPGAVARASAGRPRNRGRAASTPYRVDSPLRPRACQGGVRRGGRPFAVRHVVVVSLCARATSECPSHGAAPIDTNAEAIAHARPARSGSGPARQIREPRFAWPRPTVQNAPCGEKLIQRNR